MNYNLLEENWIPVLYHDGRCHRVGIRKVLEDASEIRQIAASNPMDRVGILRFLLALFYWCKGNPPDSADMAQCDSFPGGSFTKLDRNRERFYLLGDGERFYQCRDSGNAVKKLSANYLVHEVPTGRNAWHFRHATDGTDGLCPACCAIGLLRLPLFATSGGRGKPPSVNAKPPFYVVPVGKSLAATLRLSWRKVSGLGTPAWEEPDMRLPNKDELPLLTGLTWLPRRVWLDEPNGPEANCKSCGSRERLIRHCVFAGIGSTRTDDGTAGRIWRDPHVIYEQYSVGEVTSLRASNARDAADAAAGQWAKIIAGIVGNNESSEGASAWVVGFSTVNNDTYLEVRECFFPLPRSTEQVEPFVHNVERWQKQALARRCRPMEKSSSRKHPEISAAISAIRPQVENAVSAKVGELLAGGDEAWQQAASEYRPMMESIAKSLSPGFTTAALLQRQQMANVMPDMRPEIKRNKKSARKKGDAT